MLDYHELSHRIHGMAKEKGWWEDGKRPNRELLMLMLTEIAEATEEVRSNKPDIYWNTPTGVVTHKDVGESYNLSVGDTLQKPEGEPVELADAAIRIFDVLGHYDLSVINATNAYREAYADTTWDNELEAHFDIAEALAGFAKLGGEEKIRMGIVCAKCLCLIERYFEIKGWDLAKVINMKVEFNATRPARHGGKKY